MSPGRPWATSADLATPSTSGARPFCLPRCVETFALRPCAAFEVPMVVHPC